MVTEPRRAMYHAESTAPPKPRVNLLIVDDDATKRFALRTILAPLDEHVVEASSGADALRQLLRSEFAVILLDVRMPVMDGFETAHLVRQRPRSELTPIIFVTALDEAETDMARGYNLGAVDFIFAPVVPAILRAKVTVFADLYRAQQELRRYRTQLESLVEERTIALTAINRELEAFSYSVANDLRSPLMLFDAVTRELLADYGDRLDRKGKANLERMRRTSERMASVFDGLQMLLHLSSGGIRREQVDITAMARDIANELKAAHPQHKVELEIAPDITVSADKRLTRILLTNLLSNAWRFTAGRSPARISFGRETVDGESRLFVKDNGVGFDMIDSHRLFTAFQRLHSQSDFPGAGIGLASARRIVNRHGGRIWAEGAVGEGATFYFVL